MVWYYHPSTQMIYALEEYWIIEVYVAIYNDYAFE